MLPRDLKDIYVVDRGVFTIPKCNSDYLGKNLRFYKWGGSHGSVNITSGGGNGAVFDRRNTVGFVFPNGISYNNNTLTMSNTNLQEAGFRMINLICMVHGGGSVYNWFPDFGFR